MSPVEELLERDFLAFWKAYPTAGKEKKPLARKAYRAARRKGHTARTILAGVAAWIDTPRWQGGFVAHATTFLNSEMFEDDPYAAETERELAEEAAE